MRRRRGACSWALAVELVSKPAAARELLQQPAVAGGVQRVRRQRREPACDVVAGRRGEREIEVGAACPPRRGRCAPGGARLRLALEGGEAKRRRFERGDGGVERGLRRLAVAALLPQQQRLAAPIPSRRARACRPLAAARTVLACAGGHAATSSVSARAPTRSWQQSPSLRTLRAYSSRSIAACGSAAQSAADGLSGRNTMAAE